MNVRLLVRVDRLRTGKEWPLVEGCELIFGETSFN